MNRFPYVLFPAILLIAFLPLPSLQAGTFSYTDFSSTTGLNLVSSAAQVGSDLRLSPASAATAGAAWETSKHNVASGFVTEFEFRLSAQGGSTDADGLNGGDGLAFVVQNTSNTAIGNTNSYMGYEIANSVAIEFDSWRNGNFIGFEPSSNHVGVQSLGTAVNSPTAPSAYLGSAAVTPNMSDGLVHTGKVVYSPGTLSVFVDDLGTPVLSVPVDLSTLLSLDSGSAYVGFTAGGSSAIENQDLLGWTFNSVPEPTSLMLTAVMLAAWGSTRRR